MKIGLGSCRTGGMNRLSYRSFVGVALVVGLGCAGSGPLPPPATAHADGEHQSPPAAESRPVAKAPLFDRLGGLPAMEAVADGFLKRVAADTRINGRFLNTDLVQLRKYLVEFFCNATGGPCKYSGRDMHTAHAGMQLVDEEFDALVEDLVGALDALKVPVAEKNEILGALGPLKPKIVSPPSKAAAEHDPLLVKAAQDQVLALRGEGKKDAANLLESAVAARVRGQRSYAEQLYSAAERQLDSGGLPKLEPLFRDGGPERIKSKLKTMPKDTPAQPKTAVGGSDEDDPDAKPKRGSLAGTIRFVGKTADGTLGLITLTPLKGKVTKRKAKERMIEQRGREFAPKVLAIPVGSTVQFPNFDPIYHNVFSLSKSKPFDLGSYKNGESRDVTFGKEGIVRLGCNLHANMSAYIIVVSAPHYVIADPSGNFRFRSLAPGSYTMQSWSGEGANPVTQQVVVKPGENTIALDLPVGAPVDLGTDKFGVPRGTGP